MTNVKITLEELAGDKRIKYNVDCAVWEASEHELMLQMHIAEMLRAFLKGIADGRDLVPAE